jgi:hypothetical protein
MKFLWIEDNDKIEILKQKFFLDAECFQPDLHKIEIPKNFDDAFLEVENARIRYDFIILDINLENFEIGDKGKKIQKTYSRELNENEFLQEAGFHLYLQLITLGFDKERIIFLTGNTNEKPFSALLWQFELALENERIEEQKHIIEELRTRLKTEEYEKIAMLLNQNPSDLDSVFQYWNELIDKYEGVRKADNSYDKFKERFFHARLPIPFSIQKDCVADFHKWLNGKTTKNEKQNYIMLRRAIIESCSKLIEIIEKKDLDSVLLFNKTVFQDLNPLNKEDVIRYLRKLMRYFPLHSPKDKRLIYSSFIRELSDLWERSKGYLQRKNFGEMDEIEFDFKNFCQNQMKLMRNWTAHNQLSENLTEKEIAYYFLIAIRALFKLDEKKLYSFEALLFSFFTEQEFERKELENYLATSYAKLRSLSIFKRKNPAGNQFNEIINSIGKVQKKQEEFIEMKEMSVPLFYQNFFHSLIKPKIHIFPNTNYKSKVQISIKFADFPNLSEYSFLSKLANSICSEAFEINKDKNLAQ